MKTTLQVPMDKKIKEASEKTAKEFGYSSLQEVVRVFLKQFATGRVVPTFSGYDEFLTSEQEAVLTDKYLHAKENISRGKGKIARSVDDLTKALNAN